MLYVGKAVNLRNRVRSYFQASTRHGSRIARLVQKVREIETIVVDSEIEALVLECNLIKKHRPPFNVRLRDDKSYPYIVITKEAFPRVLFTRKVRKDGGKYFGPYTSAFQVRDTLKLLHKIFPLIPCGKTWSGEREQRPCLYYHLGQCLAPCAGMASKAKYAEVLGSVERFLQGKEEAIVESMKEEMAKASEDLDFEEAAAIRDRIGALEHVLQRQKVLVNDQADRDVIAVVKDDRGSAIQMLYVRGGKLIGQRQYILDGSADVPTTEAVQEFVKQYYLESPDLPKEILLPVEIEERNIMQSWLRQQRGSAVKIEVPQGGEKLRLVEMAAANAEQALSALAQELEQKEAWAAQAGVELQTALELAEPPVRIEAYDISNVNGMAPAGSMVVIENGEPAKAEYRRFKIRMDSGPNDAGMMHEVILRRLRAYLDGDAKFSTLPDLIIVDGGKPQLGAALRARDELGLTVPMAGLAKRNEILYMPVGIPPELALPSQIPELTKSYQYREIELPLHAPGLLMLRRLRDEAHRFALSYHRKVRDKRMTGSALEEVPGVGPRRKRLLLRTFGSVEGIRRATVDEIAAVPTLTRTLAEQLKDFLQEA